MKAARAIARPYAKAVFNYAIESKQLSKWADLLSNMVLIVADSRVCDLIKNPQVAKEEILELFIGVLETSLDENKKNFVLLLIERNRLFILPEIIMAFEKLRAEHEKRIDVQVLSAFPLTNIQQASLIQALEKRLEKKVDLHEQVDPDVLGGAIIQAGDLVIDGSGKNRLAKLDEYLKGKSLCD